MGVFGGSTMAKAIATMLGLLIAAHGILSLFVEGSLLLGVFNADAALDVLYLLSAVVLLVAGATGSSQRGAARTLAAIGVVYAVVGLLGLADHRLGGVTPTGLTLMDYIFFFAVAGSALATAVLPGGRKPLEWAGTEPIEH